MSHRFVGEVVDDDVCKICLGDKCNGMKARGDDELSSVLHLAFWKCVDG